MISPLLSNIILNEFDQYLNKRYLSGKARKDRWYWNHSIQRGRSTAVKENWQWNLPLLTVAMPMTVCHEGASWGRESLCSHAAQEMREGPLVSACRRRHQTIHCCCI